MPATGHGVVLPNVEIGADGLGGITTRGVSVIRDANGFGVSATEGGLRPPTPISVEPNGMPRLPTDDADPIPVGDEADDPIPVSDEADAVPADGVLVIPTQAAEAPPDVPPPSNVVIVPELPAVGIPVLKEFPGIDVPMPGDSCGSEPPTPEHVAVKDVIGLTPGDVSSVEPMGVLSGATGEPGPMPSGDVMPSCGPGEMLIPPICA